MLNKNIKELASQLADKKIKLQVNSSVRKYLIKNCFENNNGAHYKKLMAFGRKTDKRINLFEQHQPHENVPTIDNLIEQMEAVVKKEYQEGTVSGKAKVVLDKTIGLMKTRRSICSDLENSEQ